MKKKFLKALVMVGCAILLVIATITGTVAYLTSVKEVTNTFTVGKVEITLDESDMTALDPTTAPRVKEKADFKLSMGPMTFPHHLARIMVLEQIYRAEAIQAGSKYHK